MHFPNVNFSSLIAVCSSSLCKWAQRLFKSLAFNWRTQMCHDSRDGSREWPLVNFNYSQHAFELIQLNCCGKAEAQLLLALSRGSSGITHYVTYPSYWNQNINQPGDNMFIKQQKMEPMNSSWKWASPASDKKNDSLLKLHLTWRTCVWFYLFVCLFICLFVCFFKNMIPTHD